MSEILPVMVALAVEQAGLAPLSNTALNELSIYGNLLLHWGSRINLTAIRDVEGILARHLVESIAAAQALPGEMRTLLDYGTGAGLPGIPIAIVRREMTVTLAESQSKKIAFLREAVRSLGLRCSIHPGRVETLSAASLFDGITMRAVDKPAAALRDARSRLRPGGSLVLFATPASRIALIDCVQAKNVVELPLPGIGSLLLCKFEELTENCST